MTDNHSPNFQEEPADTRAGATWRNILPGILVSLVSLLILASVVDLSRLAQALLLADYRWVLAAIGSTVIWLVVRAFFWRTLLQNQPPFGAVFFTLNEGYLLNNLLPFRLGEIGRAYLLSRKTALDFWRILPTIVIERALDLAFATGLLFSTLPFLVGAGWARQAAMGVGIALLAGFALLYLLAHKRDWVRQQLTRLSARRKVIERIATSVVVPLLNGLEVMTDGRRFVLGILWAALNWAIGVGQYYLMMRAFFPDARLLWVAFTLGVAALGIAIPSSPSAVGVFELAIVGALSVFSLSPSVALALAVTLHVNQVVVTGIFGAYALGREGDSLAGLYRRAIRFRRRKTL